MDGQLHCDRTSRPIEGPSRWNAGHDAHVRFDDWLLDQPLPRARDLRYRPDQTPLATDRALGGAFHVEAVVTVVDAVTGADTLEWSAEARRQAILADRLIITKTDIAGDSALTTLSSRLRALNPGAEILEAVNGEIDPRHLVEPVTDQRNPFVAEAAHSDGIGSFVLTEETPIPWAVFARSMDTLMQLCGPDLLRVKAFLDVEGCKGPVLVQFVQHLAHPPVELEAWPDTSRQSRVVFITRNISEHQVRTLVRAIRALV